MTEIQLKQYEYQKVETNSKLFILPNTIEYFFETGIRRSIKVIPILTTWQKTQGKISEEIWKYKFICVYNNFEAKIEMFDIHVKDIEDNYYKPNSNMYNLIQPWVDKQFNIRTKEQFDADLNEVYQKLISEY